MYMNKALLNCLKLSLICREIKEVIHIKSILQKQVIYFPTHSISFYMEMRRKMRRGVTLVIICLIIMVLFSTDGTKEPAKEYRLTDKEILGQEVEWELVQSHIPILAYLFHEQNGDNVYEQYVLQWFPVFRYLTDQEVLAKEKDNWEELAIGTELEKGLLEENARQADGQYGMDENAEGQIAEGEGTNLTEQENREIVEDTVDTSQVFLTPSDFIPASQKQKEYDWSAYTDMAQVRKEFFAIDATTDISDDRIAPQTLLEKDISLSEGNGGPQILIYHTHSQETFVDSIPGDPNTSILGAGEYLARLLRDTYGYEVLHHTGEYDVESRDYAYSNALPNIEAVLAEYPSIEVVIDLHRDAVAEDTKLVSQQNGKTAAQVMFFNGLSHTKKQGDIEYLKNPYIDDNLAFSFQMHTLCNEYYPGLTRRIYLKGYRYNMHLCSKSLLIELGAQTNTCDEVKNTLDIVAHVLDMCLSGEEEG